MGNLGDGSAVVLNDPRGQVASVVIEVLIAIAGNAVGLVFGRKAKLPQTVILIVYRFSSGYVKLFEENSPVRAAGGLSLQL